MPNVLPPDFADLEPFADWAIPTERARYAKRISSTMDELQRFYDAAFPRLDAATDYLRNVMMDDIAEDQKRLVWLFCSLITVAFPAEAWRQPKVPDSGASSIDAILEPVV